LGLDNLNGDKVSTKEQGGIKRAIYKPNLQAERARPKKIE